ncbi:MAG: START domain-containing protein [Smithellaceae bacterium]|nr:START domain-containing protein [Smithellaceae bacterium]
MKKKVGLIILSCLLLMAALPQLTFADAEWKQVKQSDGITIFNRPYPGSDVDEFRGVTIVRAPIEVITEVLYDVPAQPKWMSDCLAARTVKVISENHIIAYNVLNVPWPVTDRDFLADTVFNTDFKAGKVLVEMKAVKEPLVPVGQYVRMTDLAGTCLLERLGKDKTKVTYTMRANPAGNIPAAIANVFAQMNPYNTLKGLKRMVGEPKYIELAKKKYGL